MSSIAVVYGISLYENQDGTYDWYGPCLNDMAITDSPDAFFKEYIDLRLSSTSARYLKEPEGYHEIRSFLDRPETNIMLSSDNFGKIRSIFWVGDGSKDPRALAYLIGQAIYTQMNSGYDSSGYYHRDLGDDSLEYYFCKLARLEKEFKDARSNDIDSVKSVVVKAAEILDVKIPALEA